MVGDSIEEAKLMKYMSTHHFFIDRTWFPGFLVAMTIESWNYRGLGNILAVQVLRELVRTHIVDFIFLFETLCHSNRAEEVRHELGFDGS